MDFSTIRDQFTSKCKEILNADQIKTQDIILLAKWFRDFEKTTITPSNVKDFVVLIINFFINLHKFSELKKFKSQFLTTFRVTCGTILHVIDSLNIHSLVIKRSSRIIKLITTHYSHSICTKELLKVFNVCLGKATSQIIEATADKHKIVICNLYNIIEDTSDVELQFVVLEAVLRFFHTKRLRSILYQLAPKNEKLKTILESEDPDLYGTIRSYINEFNRNSSRIFSIKCNLISLESAVVGSSPNRNSPIKEAWLDFDLRERKISFFCNKEFFWSLPNKLIFPTISEWEVVSFFAEDKIKTDFIYCDVPSAETIKLMIKLNTRNINLFCDTQSEIVKTLVIVTSVDSPESDKFTCEILPEMFPDTFNLDANSQVSSYHALCVPVRESETPDLMLDRVTSPEIRFERDKFLKVRTDEELERSTLKRFDQQDQDYFSLTHCNLSNDSKASLSDVCIIDDGEDEINLSQDLRDMFRNFGEVTKRMSKGPPIEIPGSRPEQRLYPPGKVKLSRLNRSDTANDSFPDQSVHEIFRNLKETVPKLSKSAKHVVLNKSISPLSFARSMKSLAVQDNLTEETEYREEINMQLEENAFIKLSKGNPMSLANYAQSPKQVSQLGSQQSRVVFNEESFAKSSEDIEVLSHTKVKKWLSHSGDASKYSDLLTEDPQIICIDEPNEMTDLVCEESQYSSGNKKLSHSRDASKYSDLLTEEPQIICLDEPNEMPDRVCDEPQNSGESQAEPLNSNPSSLKRDKERIVDEFQPIIDEINNQIGKNLKKNSNECVEIISKCLLNKNKKYQAGNRDGTPKMSQYRNWLGTSIFLDLTNDSDETENSSWSGLSEDDDSSDRCRGNKMIKKKFSKNKKKSKTLSKDKAKTKKTSKTIKMKLTKNTKNKKTKRGSILIDSNAIQNIPINTENPSKLSNCTVVLEDVLAPKKKRTSGFNCLPLEARIKAEEIRLLNERSMASVASSKNSSEKIVISIEKSLNENKRPQSLEKVVKKRKSNSAKKNKHSVQKASSRKSYCGEDGFEKGLITEDEKSNKENVIRNLNLDKNKSHANHASVVSSSCEDTPKAIPNTEQINKKKLDSPEKTTKRRRTSCTKKNKNLIYPKQFVLDSQKNCGASKTLKTEHANNERSNPKNVAKQSILEKKTKNEANSENLGESLTSNPSLIADSNEVSPNDVVTNFSRTGKESQSASGPHGIEKIVAHVQCEDISTTRTDCCIKEKSHNSTFASSTRNSPVNKMVGEKSFGSGGGIEINLQQDLNRSSSDATKDKVNSTLQSIFKGLSDSESEADMQPLEPMRTNELIDVLETQIPSRVGVEETPNVVCLRVDSTLQNMFKDLSDSERSANLLPLEPIRTNELINILETQISQQLRTEELPKAICLPTPTSSSRTVPKSFPKSKRNKPLEFVMPLQQHSQHQEPISEGEVLPSLTKSSPNSAENSSNRNDILNSTQLKITETPKFASVKRNTRKLFDTGDMSYLDECLNRNTEIWEAKIKEEKLLPNAPSKKKPAAKAVDTNIKKIPKTREVVKGNSKKRALVPALRQKQKTIKTDVSLAKTQEQIIRLRQLVQDKKKDSVKKRKFKKEEGSDSDVSVENRNQLKKPKINIISNVVLNPLEENGRANASKFVFGRREYKEFQVENLVNALSFATERDLSKTNLSIEILLVLDKYL